MKIIKLSERVFSVYDDLKPKIKYSDVYIKADQIMLIRAHEEGSLLFFPWRGFSTPVKETPEQILEIIKKTPEI